MGITCREMRATASARAFYENSLDVIVGRSRTISNAKALQGINNSGG